MNYFGKFDATVSDALGQHPSARLFSESVHAAHVPADAVVVSDAQLLFNAEFKRSGVDLVLSGDGREVVLHDYFKGPTRAPIASPDGAHLTGDIVTALAGEVQLAQADGSAGAHAVIGHVTKLVGSATAVRNGVSIILNNGDNVEKGDVVASGSDSTVGITFIDGTVFGLSSNARMVLNEMVYDPNGSNNSSLLSLVAGTITFVAGETAKHGDMKVDTPVATMGIRGTAVLVEIDFTVPGTTPDAKFQVLVEPDGTTGSYILFDKQTLTPLAVVDHAGMQINISNGVLSQTLVPLSPEIQKLITDVFSLKFSDSSNTKSIEHFTDSIVPTDAFGPIKITGLTPNLLIPVTITSLNLDTPNNPPPPNLPPHLPNVLHIATTNGTIIQRAGATGTGQDTISGTVNFVDGNPFDRPTVSAQFSSFSLHNAQGQDISGTLTAQQLNAIEAALTLTANPGNNNNGADAWTYSVPASALSFLTAGETLTLTYNATVNNNFGPADETVTAPITITIKTSGEIWSETKEIASPAPGDWSNGANWQTGVAPTASDDVIIVTDPAQSGTPFYPVTIKSAEAGGVPASANSVFMNDLGDIPPELDNYNTGDPEAGIAGLTIGSGGLHMSADSILRNFGTISIGGIAEILQHSVLQNSGTLTLKQGGDFNDSSQIINSGTIEIAGDPLHPLNVRVNIDNDGGTLRIDDNAAMMLADGATVAKGFIEVGVNSVLHVESPDGATLDDVTVTANVFGAIDIGVNTTGGSNLTLKDGTSITGGSMTIAADSTLDVESAGGATLDFVTATANLTGAIEIGVNTEGGSILTLKDVTSITGGNMTIAANSLLDIESAGGAALDGVTVTGTSGDAPSTIEIGVNTISGSILTLLDGTSISYGDMTIAANSTLDIESAGGATLHGVTVTNLGTIQVDGEAPPTTVTLVLDGGTKIIGGSLLIHNPGPDEGVVEIESGGATFDDLTVTNNNELIIDATVTLTLTDNTSILGGTIDDAGTLLVSSASEIDNATIDGGGKVAATGGTLTLSGATLDDVTLSGSFKNADTLTLNTVTLDGVTLSGGTDAATAVTVSADSEIDHATVTGDITVDPDVTLTLNTVTLDGVTLSGGTDTATGVTVSADSEIDNATVTGDITVNTGKTLTLHTVTLGGVTLSGGTDAATGVIVSADSEIDNATVKGDITVDTGKTLTLDTVTLAGATLNGGIIADIGTLSVTASSEIENATVNGGGSITVGSGKTLTLNTVTLDNVTLAGGFSDVGTVTIDETVTLNGATLSGGTLDVSGILDSMGTSFITGATIVNSSQINVLNGSLTIDPAPFTNAGTIEVDGKASLVLSGETVTNSVTVGPTTTNGTIQIDAQGLLTLNGSTIDRGIVDNFGTIDVTAASSIDDTFSFVNSGTVNADGAALTLSGTNVSNSGGTLESTGSGLLKLVNATINSGTLGGKIATATGNSSSTLNGITLAVSSLVTATVGVLELTGLITNNGEFDAGAGATLDLDNATVKGGTLGGNGTIVTASSSFDTLNGVTISHGTTVTVADGTTLELVGTITDAGTIALGSSGHATQLEISGSVSLAGGGSVTMSDSSHNFIVSDGHDATLTNSDTISGAGTIGDSHLTLINNGTIDATGTNPLIINTSVTNNHGGVLEASAGATLDINGNVVNDGLIEAGSSAHVTITGNVTNSAGSTGAIDIFAHATVEITGTVSSGQTATFEQSNGAGLLILDDSHDFKGTITGLTEANPENTENHVDLKDLAWHQGSMSVHYNNTTDQLTIANSFNHDSVTLKVVGGSSGEFEIASDGHTGTLLDDPSATGNVTIDSDQLLGVTAASSATVTFTNTSGNTGELMLSDSKDFTGTIAGFAGDGTIANSDLIDITDVNFADVATSKTTYTENADGTGTLTLYNASGQALDSLNFTGNYQLANFTIENDGSGGTLIVDPPVNTSSPTPSNTVVASGPNETLSGSAPPDNFVFNFAAVGHSAIANFNPAADMIQFSSSVFANIQSILNAVHDDGHGNSVIAIDAHDSIALNGVNKAQLHANDFHIV